MNEQTLRDEQRMLTLISYVLHLLGSIVGLPSLIALLINYMKRDARTPLDSHHRWMIRTFWWTILWMVVAWLMILTVILMPFGWVFLGVVWLWWIYRHVRGLICLLDGGRMPA